MTAIVKGFGSRLTAVAALRNGIVEIAGPERAPFNEIVARYLKAVGDPREVVTAVSLEDPDHAQPVCRPYGERRREPRLTSPTADFRGSRAKHRAG